MEHLIPELLPICQDSVTNAVCQDMFTSLKSFMQRLNERYHQGKLQEEARYLYDVKYSKPKQNELRHETQLWFEETRDLLYDAQDIWHKYAGLCYIQGIRDDAASNLIRPLCLEIQHIWIKRLRDYLSDIALRIYIWYCFTDDSHMLSNNLDTIAHNHYQFSSGNIMLAQLVYHYLETGSDNSTPDRLVYQWLETPSLGIQQLNPFEFKLYRQLNNCTPECHVCRWLETPSPRIQQLNLFEFKQNRQPVRWTGEDTSYVRQSQVSEASSLPKQQSECKANHSPSSGSIPSSGDRKAEDLWGGSWEEDKKQGGRKRGMATRGDKDEKSDYNNSSFTLIQLSTLAISTLLLCLLPLLRTRLGTFNTDHKEEDDDNKAIAAAALIVATLASRISLETIPKRPELARPCGYLAALSLLLALASLLSSFLFCLVTI